MFERPEVEFLVVCGVVFETSLSLLSLVCLLVLFLALSMLSYSKTFEVGFEVIEGCEQRVKVSAWFYIEFAKVFVKCEPIWSFRLVQLD